MLFSRHITVDRGQIRWTSGESDSPHMGRQEFKYSLGSFIQTLHFSIEKCPSPPRDWLVTRKIWPSWFHKPWNKSDRKPIRSTIWVLWYLEYRYSMKIPFRWEDLSRWKEIVCNINKRLGVRTRARDRPGHSGPQKRSDRNHCGSARSKKRMESFLTKKLKLTSPVGFAGIYVPPGRRAVPPRPPTPVALVPCPDCPRQMMRRNIVLRIIPKEDFEYYRERMNSRYAAISEMLQYRTRYGLVYSGWCTSRKLQEDYPGIFNQHELEEADRYYNYAHPLTCARCMRGPREDCLPYEPPVVHRP